MIMVSVLFGLSMDYQVFLVSRMYEEWLETGDNRRAVRVGLAETGRVINSAAVIMISVFLAFVLSGDRVIADVRHRRSPPPSPSTRSSCARSSSPPSCTCSAAPTGGCRAGWTAGCPASASSRPSAVRHCLRSPGAARTTPRSRRRWTHW